MLKSSCGLQSVISDNRWEGEIRAFFGTDPHENNISSLRASVIPTFLYLSEEQRQFWNENHRLYSNWLLPSTTYSITGGEPYKDIAFLLLEGVSYTIVAPSRIYMGRLCATDNYGAVLQLTAEASWIGTTRLTTAIGGKQSTLDYLRMADGDHCQIMIFLTTTNLAVRV